MTLDRRTFLRGCGTAVALPFLDAMLPRAWAAPAAPRRLAFLFVPNGIHMPDWTPATEGGDYALPHLLEPLAALRGDVAVLTGLAHDKARANGDGPGDHARSAAVFLTGAQPFKTAGANLRAGVSVDQVAAHRLGAATRFPSLELGCEPGLQAGSCDSGYSCAYSSNISWRTPQLPMAKEVDPRLLFERLFEIGPGPQTAAARARRLAERSSILDYVRDDARRLHARLGRGDRAKLDEYFEGVREIERRLEMAAGGNADAGAAGLAPPAGIPREYAEHVRLMYDLLVLAFRLDLTRVATFMLANEGSNRSYDFVGAPDGHHNLSHHGGDRVKIDKIRRINRFHTEQLAYFLGRMKENGLLDSSLVVYGSAISDGNAHNHDNLPILLAGRGGGTFEPGRHLAFAPRTPLCNLYVSLLDATGTPTPRFGDSTGPLAGFSRREV